MAIEENYAAPPARKHLGRHTMREESTASSRPIPSYMKHEVKETIKDHRESAKATFPLQWAKPMVVPSATGLTDKLVLSAQSRQLIVKELYPRILYTFSDVVCYVTNNPRSVLHFNPHLTSHKLICKICIERLRMSSCIFSNGQRAATTEQSTSA